jgi:hypothetical protein
MGRSEAGGGIEVVVGQHGQIAVRLARTSVHQIPDDEVPAKQRITRGQSTTAAIPIDGLEGTAENLAEDNEGGQVGVDAESDGRCSVVAASGIFLQRERRHYGEGLGLMYARTWSALPH